MREREGGGRSDQATQGVGARSDQPECLGISATTPPPLTEAARRGAAAGQGHLAVLTPVLLTLAGSEVRGVTLGNNLLRGKTYCATPVYSSTSVHFCLLRELCLHKSSEDDLSIWWDNRVLVALS